MKYFLMSLMACRALFDLLMALFTCSSQVNFESNCTPSTFIDRCDLIGILLMISVTGAISVLEKIQSSVFSPFTFSPDCLSHFIISSSFVLRFNSNCDVSLLVTIGKLSSANRMHSVRS